MGSLVAVAFWVLAVAVMLVATAAAGDTTPWRPPRASTAALWLIVLVPSLVQLLVPAMLSGLRRDWPRILDGQIWRLVTSVVVQDGGVAGLLFNASCLTLVLLGAQLYWSGIRIWTTFWAGAIVSNLAVGPDLQPTGAGSSMAAFVLGSAIAANALCARQRLRAVGWAWVVVGCAAVMVVGRDYHAVACAVGLLAGLLPPYGSRSARR